MTDGIEQGKPEGELVEEYIENYPHEFGRGEIQFLDVTGITLSSSEKELYYSLPDFHREFLERIYPQHRLKFSLYRYSRGESGSIERLKQYEAVRLEWLGLRLSVKELIALVFPFGHLASFPPFQLEPSEFLNNPERVITKDIARLVRKGILVVDHLPAYELDSRYWPIKAISEKYPRGVVNLLDVEKVKDYLRSDIDRGIIKVWREYLNLQNIGLKKNEDVTQKGPRALLIDELAHVGGGSSLLTPHTFKKKSVSGSLETLIVKAYESYCVKEGNAPKNCEELFKWITSENMPDDVSCLVLGDKKAFWSVKRLDNSEHKWNTFRNIYNKLIGNCREPHDHKLSF